MQLDALPPRDAVLAPSDDVLLHRMPRVRDLALLLTAAQDEITRLREEADRWRTLYETRGKEIRHQHRIINTARADREYAFERLRQYCYIVLDVVRLSVDDCPWCDEQSWYGDAHMETCPVFQARALRRLPQADREQTHQEYAS